ncbi:acyl-CoA thioesterase [Amycolatopsis acidicola]|uniref:Acyl-CoA thioesterase n=1 Tax=Amycolatopsis acidicola TaxID=2596893 RepID=A0A5N0UW95_9PSEU|nr:thioesterase family protein [Amycolatopsis acidicola]KAA9154510.1 acyl-CoA thioesterase [Amycolatopsis acidicola]
MAKTIARLPIRVRYHECDQQGIVFNAHYLAYFDMASLEFFREVFGSYENLRARGVDTVVAESNLTYRAPNRYDDDIVVEVGVEHLGRTSLILVFTIVRDGEVVTAGTNRYVFVDAESLAKAAPPDDVREKLAALL